MKYQQDVQRSMDEFFQAISNHDLIECAKKIGVMEYLSVPNTNYFMAYAYQENGELDKAIKIYETIDESSECYALTLNNLAIDYMLVGDYLKLHRILTHNQYSCTPLEEIDLRINCIEHMRADDFMKNREAIKSLYVRDVPSANYSGNEAEIFFAICSMLTDALTLTNEMIYQCSKYQFLTGVPIEDVENTADLTRFVDEYEKWCFLLELSAHLQIIKVGNGQTSLAECALKEYPWAQKLHIFNDTNHVQQIMKIILRLCDPNLHPTIAPIRPVKKTLESFMHIDPSVIAFIINRFFDTVAEAYNDDPEIAQYIGYAYSEIIATESDPFSLSTRIKALWKEDDLTDIQETAVRIKLVRNMSQKGYNALINAENVFKKTKDISPGTRDFSALSLLFFRIVEIEYCEKLICPTANEVDIDHLNTLAAETKEEWKRKKWEQDGIFLEKIKSRKQASIQIGAIRTLLSHLVNDSMKDDKCADYLRQIVLKHLTDQGKQALLNNSMLDVIKASTLDEYRTPGAHTGFLPYSAACRGVNYVCEKLPVIESWFC